MYQRQMEKIGCDILKVCKNKNELPSLFSIDAKRLWVSLVEEHLRKNRKKEKNNDWLIALLINGTFLFKYYISNLKKKINRWSLSR